MVSKAAENIRGRVRQGCRKSVWHEVAVRFAREIELDAVHVVNIVYYSRRSASYSLTIRNLPRELCKIVFHVRLIRRRRPHPLSNIF